MAVDGADEVSQGIYEIWRQLLAIDAEDFDPERGFVASGGYSLLALRLVDTVAERFGVRLELSQFLDDISARVLATRVHEQRRGAERSSETGLSGWEEGFV